VDRFVNFFWRALNPPNTPQRLELSPVGAWDGVGTARTTQSACCGPEKLSRGRYGPELRWGPFLPVPSGEAPGRRGCSWGLSQFQAPSPAALSGDCAQGPEKLGMYLTCGVDQST
jgi:hypothetical protein